MKISSGSSYDYLFNSACFFFQNANGRNTYEVRNDAYVKQECIPCTKPTIRSREVHILISITPLAQFVSENK